MPKFIDVHAHVQFAAYVDDMDAVIKRSLDNEVWLVNVGTQRNTSAKAVEVAKKYKEGVYATIGIHPIHAEKSYHDDYEYYKKLGGNAQVLAIGECGLDYYRLNEETKKKQEEVFRAQIDLASDLKKPLMVHCRNAFPDLINILRANKSKLMRNYPGIAHFFTGTIEDAKALMELGFYFSFGGVTTFTRDYDEVLKAVTLERILLETDAPYVSPVPFRGKRNEPAYISYTAQAIAKVFGLAPHIVAEKTTESAKKVLGIK